MKKLLFSLFLMTQMNLAQVISGTAIDSISQLRITDAKVLITNFDNGFTDSTYTNSLGNWSYDFTTTSIENDDYSPAQYLITKNYPNPFNPSTTIEFILPKSGSVKIFIHNILGQLIDSREAFLNAGSCSIKWNARGSAGVYFYTIKTDNESVTNKMILLDGGSGNGLTEFIQKGNIQNYGFNKSSSIQTEITISKLGYVSKIINASVIGGEHFNTKLITVHSSATLIDLHNDILEVMAGEPSYHLGTLHTTHHTDIPRLQKGGVDVQFFANWVNPSYSENLYYDQAQVMMNIFNYEMSLNSNNIGQARNLQEAIELNKEGKIAAIIGVEGGHSIENNLDNLLNLYNQGMRYLTITWNNSTSWAVSAQDSRSATVGLSDFGRSVIGMMDSLGVIIDVSHTGIKTILDILEVTKNPIVATHSGVRAIKNHYRNLYDDQIKAIAKTGGVIGVVFYPPFLTTGTADIDNVIQHIDYIVNLVGIDYVAIGSDFDGIGSTPIGLEDVSKFPALTLKLLEHGYSQQDVEKILGVNFMRVFEQVCSSKKHLVIK